MKTRYRVILVKYNPISGAGEESMSFYFTSMKKIDNVLKMLKDVVENGKTEKILTRGNKNGK